MEPGHEDREDDDDREIYSPLNMPQWSQVTKTGKT